MEITYIIVPLLITLIIEPLFFFAVGYRDKRFFIICLLINFITNLTMTLFMGLSYWMALDYHWETTLFFEIGIVLVEGLVYYLNDRRVVGFAWSLAANAISFTVGLFIYYFIYGRTYL